MKILVVFDSFYGHTEKFAHAISDGAAQAEGAQTKCLSAEQAQFSDLNWADGIIIGCPTHMGTASWKMKKFIDEAFSHAWMNHSLVGKVGGVFATGGSGGAGGSELTLLGLASNMAQNGLTIVPFPRNSAGYKPDGMHWGPVWATRSDKELRPENIEAAHSYGKRFAEITGKLSK